MLDLVVNSSVTHTLLLVLPVACALLLRWARCPGSGLIGGVIAGVILGPTLLGRVAPDDFEHMFIGGETERVAFEDVVRAHERERVTAGEARVGEEALAEMRLRHGAEYQETLEAWRTAQWKHQRPLRSFTSAILVLTMLGAGFRRLTPGPERIDLRAAGSIGPWSAFIPGGLAFLAVWQWGRGSDVAAVTAAAVAIGPWMLSASDRAVADEAEPGGARMVERAGRIATVFALIVLGAASWLSFPERALWLLPLLAIPIGWLLPVLTRPGRVIDLALQCVLVPCLAARAALKIELYAHFAVWPVIVFLIISGDGRWLGAFTGALLAGGRRPMRATRLVLGSMACGPTQLAVTALAVHMWAIPEDVALALLIGAIVIEMTAPARRSVAERLAEAEAEADDPMV